jgi:hypothetical protein
MRVAFKNTTWEPADGLIFASQVRVAFYLDIDGHKTYVKAVVKRIISPLQ